MVENIENYIERRKYGSELLPDDFGELHPFERFKQWFEYAANNGVLEPDAATLSTFDGKRVNARTIALRGISEDALFFYTNYNSIKAKEIEKFPYVAITFYWREIFRQVRLRGEMKKVPDDISDEYFASRPRGSQISAWASRQSEQLKSRNEIDQSFKEFEEKFGETVQRPPFWGGYRFEADEYEYFQGRENRLHDRFKFVRDSNSKFSSQRLWP